jgi:hypothetical protein
MTWTPSDRTGRTRSLASIAAEIRTSWAEPHFTAVPYIEALAHMSKVTDRYGREDGDRMVLCFLNEAVRWRGETARRIKAELRQMLKEAKR